MRFFTSLALGALTILSFSSPISAIDYPTIPQLVSKEKDYVGPFIESFGQEAQSLNVSGWDWVNAGSPWANLNHDSSAFARAVHYNFLPQWAPSAPKVNSTEDAVALLGGWHNITTSCSHAWKGFIAARRNFPRDVPGYDRPNETIITLATVPGEVQVYLIPILQKFPGVRSAINASLNGVVEGANEALRIWGCPTITVGDVTQA